MRDFLWKWFSELNWRSIAWHVTGIVIIIGAGQLTPEIKSAFPNHAERMINICRLFGVLLNIWARSPAVIPLGTIPTKSNVAP